MTENKKTVEAYMEGFRRSDHAMVLSTLTDDVEWEMPGFFQLSGKDAFDKEIENEAFVGSPIIVVTRMTEEKDVVIAEGSVRAQRKDGGGDGSDSANVAMRGGSYGRHVSRMVGAPDLEVGERYVVFAPSAEETERTHHIFSIRPHCLCRVLNVEKRRSIFTPAGWNRHFRTEKALLEELRSELPRD